MKILIPCIIILFFALSGCYYDSQEFLYPQLNSACDTTNITFSGSVKPILDLCLGCHSNSTAASYGGNVKLENYADIKITVDNNKLMASINQTGPKPMPKNSAKLPDCQITIIRKWIEAGAPNN